VLETYKGPVNFLNRSDYFFTPLIHRVAGQGLICSLVGNPAPRHEAAKAVKMRPGARLARGPVYSL
jgi:hypothetical protein